MTLQLQSNKTVPNGWLFNPVATLSKNCASNLQSAKNFPNPSNRAALHLLPLGEPQSTQISLPLSPQPPSNSWRANLEMAPKKSEKDGKKKEAQPPSGEWTHSKCSLNNLNKLVSEGLLQDKNLVNWRPSFREPFPMENIDEIVTFYHFAEWGLALPSCSFFRGLLYYYGLELHHLNPNSICHIAIFIHFYEAFFGIESHWDLFRFLFRVKPQPTSKNPSVVGAPASNLDNKPATSTFHTNSLQYSRVEKSLVLHRKSCPQLTEKSNKPPVVRLEWNIKLPRGDMDQVDELLDTIAAHKEMGVTSASVMFFFFKRRV
jgi:hypothetical protein